VAEAEEEGVRVHGGWGPERFLGEAGAVRAVGLRRCTSVFDADGRFAPRFDARRTDVRPCDTIVVAIGQAAAGDLLAGLGSGPGGRVRVDPDTLATADPRVFACGDVIPGSATIIDAIAGGRRAAAAIDRRLGGTGRIDDALAAARHEPPAPPRTSGNGFAARVPIPRLPLRERLGGFRPVELGFDEAMAMEEARRCLRCDHVLRLDPERCVLCGKCEERCAYDALAWRPVERGVWRLVVRDGACQRCNDCVACCPSQALRWEPWTSPDRLRSVPTAGVCSGVSAGAA
jgi:ferredoxin